MREKEYERKRQTNTDIVNVFFFLLYLFTPLANCISVGRLWYIRCMVIIYNAITFEF